MLETSQSIDGIKKEKRTIILTGVDAVARQIDKAVASSENSFEGTATAKMFRQGMFQGGTHYRAAVKRGVHFQHVVYKYGNKRMALGDEDLKNNPLWQVRFSPTEIPFHITIIDKKEVFISSTNPDATKDAVVYYSNDTCMLVLAQNFFEILWKNAEPIP